jgi:hypothetical protein
MPGPDEPGPDEPGRNELDRVHERRRAAHRRIGVRDPCRTADSGRQAQTRQEEERDPHALKVLEQP